LSRCPINVLYSGLSSGAKLLYCQAEKELPMSALSLTLDTPTLAEFYENVSLDRQFKAGQFLLQKLEIRPGEAVLDVGAGTGLLAAHAGTLVGESGSVVGIDPLPLRIEIAKNKTRRNITFRVADAYDLSEFADESFDVVYLNAVFHWLPEKLAPLRGIHRVLKPGGRLGISTGSKAHPNSLQQVRKEVLSHPPYNRYPDSAEGVGHHVNAAELEQLFGETAFAIKSLELEPHITHHASPQAALDFVQASSFGNFFGRLPEDLRRPARVEIEAALEQLRTPKGIPQRGARLVAVATKV
jgi:arsenite methyltransferase